MTNWKTLAWKKINSIHKIKRSKMQVFIYKMCKKKRQKGIEMLFFLNQKIWNHSASFRKIFLIVFFACFQIKYCVISISRAIIIPSVMSNFRKGVVGRPKKLKASVKSVLFIHKLINIAIVIWRSVKRGNIIEYTKILKKHTSTEFNW